MLQSLESSHGNVTFINGQGTLTPTASSWHNELHPSSNGSMPLRRCSTRR